MRKVVCFGAGKIGSEMGVNAMRLSAIRGKVFAEHLRDLGYEVTDEGDVEIILPAETDSDGSNAKNLEELAASSENMAERVRSILDGGSTPIILGGDHSIAIGTFSGVSAHFHDKGEDVGLIWFDAHADINTPETTTSGNIHGMPLAAILGKGRNDF